FPRPLIPAQSGVQVSSTRLDGLRATNAPEDSQNEKAGLCSAATIRISIPSTRLAPCLFDHFVGGGLQGQRDGKAERLRGLEVDDQLELGRLLDRKRGRRRALENARDIGAGAAVIVVRVAAVADQPAGQGELARVVD